MGTNVSPWVVALAAPGREGEASPCDRPLFTERERDASACMRRHLAFTLAPVSHVYYLLPFQSISNHFKLMSAEWQSSWHLCWFAPETTQVLYINVMAITPKRRRVVDPGRRPENWRMT